MERKAMFNNLDEQIENTQSDTPTKIERLIRFAGVALLSALLFGGLYLGVLLLE
jgi:hypothetical protein